MPLEHREELQGEGLVLPVPALAAVFLECAHDEDVDEVQRLLRHLVEGVALDEEHVFVGEVHIYREIWLELLKKAAGTLVSGRSLGRLRFVSVSDRNLGFHPLVSGHHRTSRLESERSAPSMVSSVSDCARLARSSADSASAAIT